MSRFRHLITTTAEPCPCHRCGAPTLTGWADGLHARVGTQPLNRDGELAAILAGRRTYTLTHEGLVHRDRWHLTHPHGPILANHACGQDNIAAEHRAPPGAGRPRYVIPDTPPF